MEKYNVTGMSCAACQARVEKAVGNVPGVDSCAVSLLTNSMGVEGTADPDDVIKAVVDAGYGASLIDEEAGSRHGSGGATESRGSGYASIRLQEEMLRDTETPRLRKRLLTSIIFLIILMYFSMGHMMFGWPLPHIIDGNHIAMGIIQMILSAIIMLINKDFFTSGFRSLVHLAPNMDTLVALGSMASFVWSILVLFKMTNDQLAGDMDAVMSDMDGFYFESAAMIVTLITVGKMLEAMSKGRTTDALKSLMKLAPETAVVLIDGNETEVSVDQVSVGDVFVVRPGDSVPVDGVIIEGSTAVDESALTGESIPVDKFEGDEVSAATINSTGYIKARATSVGEDTTLAKIIQMVSDAAATKAPIAKIADRVSGVFVPVVIAIAIAVTVIWMMLGRDAGYSLARGISVLVISCPCALGLATPVAIMVGNGIGARNGILFKTSAALEQTGRADTVVLDKTGTITSGEPVVTDVISCDGDEEALIMYAAALEAKSEHPLARAVIGYAEEKGIAVSETSDFEAVPGKGLKSVLKYGAFSGADHMIKSDTAIYGGNLSYIEEITAVPSDVRDEAAMLSEKGKTPLYFASYDDHKRGVFLGVIAVADKIKDGSVKAISELKDMGIRVVMLTGDNERTARAIGAEAGVDDIASGVLPAGKEAVIRELQRGGNVIMVGDGINDAPALTAADTGIAIGAGTNVAIDAADVVLINSGLMDVPAAIRLSRQTVRNIHENLFWAFIYNILLIPLAAGLYTNILSGWTMNPMLGAAAMSLSSFCVCMNALRLNLFDIRDPGHDHIRKGHREQEAETTNSDDKMSMIDTNFKEVSTMGKTIMIEGMMCPHCEATVKSALEEIEGVTSADVSHEENRAVVTMDADIADETLIKAVEDKEYKVISVS